MDRMGERIDSVGSFVNIDFSNREDNFSWRLSQNTNEDQHLPVLNSGPFGDQQRSRYQNAKVKFVERASNGNEKEHLQSCCANESNNGSNHTKSVTTNPTRWRLFAPFQAVVLFSLASYVIWRYAAGWIGGDVGKDHGNGSSHGVESFKWSSVEPSERLEWLKCYGETECARFLVPLDYSNPKGAKAAIALVKYPAKVPATSEKYGGPVLINSGEPGALGTSAVYRLGKHFQTIIGEQFDVVGFDPRGVGLTTPTFYAFPNKHEAGLFYVDYPLLVNVSSESLGRAYAYSQILGAKMENSSRDVLQYVSTPAVARDMLAITKAMGYDKLQYWGFSYGSVLGATFSAMFPNNVGRIVLDGVFDAEDYYAGQWSQNLLDADAALLDVCEACVKAGPRVCRIYEETAELVLQRINRLLEKLKVAPIGAYSSPGPAPWYGIVSYDFAKLILFMSLYITHSDAAFVINKLAQFEKGDGLILTPLTSRMIYREFLTCDCSAPESELPPFYGFWDIEHFLAIACGDSEIENESFEEVQAVYREIANTSSFVDAWGIHAACSGWKVKGKERFQGSFNQKTSHPLLLVSNRADPVAPLQAAYKMSKGFEGSVVLTQNNSGHCSTSATSLCTHKAVRAYFQNGTLPEKGTVCETESSIFYRGNFLEDIDKTSMTIEDVAILEASYALQKKYFVPIHLFPSSGGMMSGNCDG
ncbi:hypothetical protein SCHPADRAFT_933433 [Schizopora paradoxa]|uniref:Alpha/beta-hydrolase n=1 Tax=Schizopora paradoxa TaxID=27342 RepID=A0A0H2R223_9AGAM|nr:hypothetical protein SCHPADRAFT_933433 [Schizopora paradoxa]